MTEKLSTMFICKNIGISGTTECHVKENDDGTFEARMGFGLMGSTNMDKAGFEAANYDPFHELFYDNYHRGIGGTKEAAISAMKDDAADMMDAFWA